MATYKQKSEIHGIGLFTDAEIKKGDYIIEVADLKRFYQDAFISPSLVDFISSKGKLVNHKKDCNCSMSLIIDKYYLIAIIDIEPNEELTIDYSLLQYPFNSDVKGFK